MLCNVQAFCAKTGGGKASTRTGSSTAGSAGLTESPGGQTPDGVHNLPYWADCPGAQISGMEVGAS